MVKFSYKNYMQIFRNIWSTLLNSKWFLFNKQAPGHIDLGKYCFWTHFAHQTLTTFVYTTKGLNAANQQHFNWNT